MSGFTPGDWWASGARVYAHSTNPLDADDPLLVADVDISVADCDMDMRIEYDTEAQANAALIAAAPELYEALQLALAQLETVDVDELWGDGGDAFSDAMESARAALAKAVPPGTTGTGET